MGERAGRVQVIEVREFGGPEVLTPADVPEPGAGPGEVVIATAAADVLHIDTMIRSGRAAQWFPVRPPYVPGNGGGSLGVTAFGVTAAGGRFSGHGAASGGFAPVDRDEAGRRGITVQRIEQVQFPAGMHEKLTGQALAEVAAGRLRPFIGQSYPLERAADAHRGLKSRSAIGKTLLIVDEAAA